MSGENRQPVPNLRFPFLTITISNLERYKKNLQSLNSTFGPEHSFLRRACPIGVNYNQHCLDPIMSSTQVIFLGTALVLIFDTIAALLSRAADISYARFAVGSWIIYAAAGYLAAKFGRGGLVQLAIRTGVLLASTDSTLGWAISWSIGPGKVDGGLTLGRWIVTALFVTAVASTLAAFGGILARIVNNGSHR
jgi:hypothetical protein